MEHLALKYDMIDVQSGYSTDKNDKNEHCKLNNLSFRRRLLRNSSNIFLKQTDFPAY